MKFIEINEWAERSECWRYHISMSVRWRDRKPFWSAWKCDELAAPRLLLVSPSHLDCVIVCEQNAVAERALQEAEAAA